MGRSKLQLAVLLEGIIFLIVSNSSRFCFHLSSVRLRDKRKQTQSNELGQDTYRNNHQSPDRRSKIKEIEPNKTRFSFVTGMIPEHVCDEKWLFHWAFMCITCSSCKTYQLSYTWSAVLFAFSYSLNKLKQFLCSMMIPCMEIQRKVSCQRNKLASNYTSLPVSLSLFAKTVLWSHSLANVCRDSPR